MIANMIMLYLFFGVLGVLIGPLARSIADEYAKVRRQGITGIKPHLYRLTLSLLGILGWPILIPSAWREQRRPKSVFQEIMELNSMMSELNQNGTDCDEIPGGKGEFGWSLDNPVPCKSIIGSRQYLNSLADANGRKIDFNRVGSFQSKHVSMPIDGYRISVADDLIGTLYISPYQKKNSRKVPSGLTPLK